MAGDTTTTFSNALKEYYPDEGVPVVDQVNVPGVRRKTTVVKRLLRLRKRKKKPDLPRVP